MPRFEGYPSRDRARDTARLVRSGHPRAIFKGSCTSLEEACQQIERIARKLGPGPLLEQPLTEVGAMPRIRKIRIESLGEGAQARDLPPPCA